MRIPRRYIENYSKSLNQISATARESLYKALLQIDYSMDIADIRNAVIDVMQRACGASADMSARLAAEFYDGLRGQFGIEDEFRAEANSQRNPEATDGAVRAFVQDLVEDKPVSQFIGKCVDRIDYETRKAANQCVEYNAIQDPKKPRWARVPTGNETCSFCIMLASRGFVYHTKETASHAHANCDCRVIPSWDKSPLAQGYDPEKYYDMWKHPEKYKEQTDNEVPDKPKEENSKVKPASERKEIYDRYQEIVKERSRLHREMMSESGERKEQLKQEILKLDGESDKQLSKLTKGEQLLEHARVWPAGDYVPTEKWGKRPSHEEVVSMLGGGDRTSGSCSSLAFAYFGNMGGRVVRDFRGGSSCNFFATYRSIKEVGGIDGAGFVIESHRNAFKAAEQIITHVQEGKRYYFTAGAHAAVVEKRDGEMYYLELQTNTENGWHKLDNNALKRRFGCKKSRTIAGMKVDQDAVLIDGETLSNSAEFEELMGFINTPEEKQKKGAGGGAK